MTVFHRKWKFIFDWQLIDASAAIQNDFRGKRLFMGEPPYLLFPEAFYVRLCYIFVVRARFSKLWLCYGNPQAAEMSVG